MQTIELKAASVHLREDGIIHIHIKDDAQMEISDAIQVVKAMGSLGKGKKFPVLIDCGEFTSVDKEARIFSASKEANIYSYADAIAYHSFAHKLVADFYVSNNKPEIPTEIFPDNEKAVEWLKRLKK